MHMDLIELLCTVPAALIAIVLHEYAHGWMSARLGDPTPGMTGRLSMNPLHHLDFAGTLMLIFFHVGWAKPVQVNPRYYKKPKLGMALTALAGPMMNFFLALLSCLGMGLTAKLFMMPVVLQTGAPYYVFYFFNICAVINIGLGAFNLIPIPPLDGSKILGAFLPEKWYFKVMRYEQYGIIVLVILLFLNVLDPIIYGMQNFFFDIFWWLSRLAFHL